MNISFNIKAQLISPQIVVDAINKLDIKTAIINGIATPNPVTLDTIQMITVLDCDSETFDIIEDHVTIKGFFESGLAYRAYRN